MAGNTKKNIEDIATLLEVDNLDVMLITQQEHITKTRYVDNKTNHLFLRVDEESLCKELNVSDLLDKIKEADITIVSDYNKGFLNLKTLMEIGSNSRLSILDTKRKIPQEVASSFTFVKLNESEFANNKDLQNQANVIVTLGERGASYLGTIFKTEAQANSDVSGAGDTFTSAFILMYQQSGIVDKSILFANVMAGIVVSKKGVKTPL